MAGVSQTFPIRAIAFAAILTLSPLAMPELVQFEVQGGAGGRLITLDSVLNDQVAYVPLEGLVEQAGGSYNVLPTRIRVDLGGSTAWLRSGESRVHSLSIFSLARPIIDDGSGALIATADVSDFFLKSFRISLRPLDAKAAPPSMPSETAVPPAPNSTPTPALPGTKTDPRSYVPQESAALEKLEVPPARRPGVVTSIVIDAGHGGYDTGLQSEDKRGEETIVLGIATRLKALLESGSGPAAVLTRSEDTVIPPQQRAHLAELSPGSIFVSIHTGSSLSPSAEGIAVFYPSAESSGGAAGLSRADSLLTADSRRLAESIGAATSASAGVPLRGIVQAPLKLLSGMQVPAIEIEVGCLSSATDAQRLASDDYLALVATGIFNGIAAYLSGASAPVATPAAAAATTLGVN